MKQTLKLYPSPTNFQHADSGPMPWKQFRSYIDRIIDSVPLEERESVKIDRSGAGVTITYEHTLTDAEIMEERRLKAIAWVQSLPRELAERDEIAKLKAIIGL